MRKEIRLRGKVFFRSSCLALVDSVDDSVLYCASGGLVVSGANKILNVRSSQATHAGLACIERTAIDVLEKKILTRSLLILYTRRFARTSDRAL